MQSSCKLLARGNQAKLPELQHNNAVHPSLCSPHAICFAGGNPARSPELQRLKQGYAQEAKRSGMKVVAAVTWTLADVSTVLSYLAQTAATEAGMAKLLRL